MKELVAKVKAVKFPFSVALSVYRHASTYNLAWTVETCELIPPDGCAYHETVVYAGELDNGRLIKLSQPFQGRTDYHIEEVEANREAYRAAKKLADDAYNKLYPFGECDR